MGLDAAAGEGENPLIVADIRNDGLVLSMKTDKLHVLIPHFDFCCKIG